jgi:threonine synthase
MQYFSTRDSKKSRYSFTDVLLKGLAEDGGLFVPVEYPHLSLKDVSTLRDLSYKDLAFHIMSRFVGDSIPASDLKEILDKTYDASVFGSEAIVPVEHLFKDIYLQDLSSGPSLAFKDMAMQFLGHVLDYELTRRGQSLIILGASSGDTVSAAEEALRGKEHIKVVMLTPKEGMSPNLSVPGPFDICQDLVKEINRDLEFKAKYNIGAVNSINWGRICAQVVYYFKGYFSVTKDESECVDVVVPSGNFGNVLAAYVAKQMGLPIRKLVVATNENVVLDTFFKTGIYEQKKVTVTSSPSMDISKASNIERYFFDLLDRNPDRLKTLMDTFDATKKIDLSDFLSEIKNKDGFVSSASTHEERKAIIQSTYKETQRIIDPHTAASVKVALEFKKEDSVPMICMETAKPTKFEEAIHEALGFIPDRPAGFEGLEEKDQRFFDVLDSAESVKSFIRSILK